MVKRIIRRGPSLRFASLSAAAIVMVAMVFVPSMAVEMPDRGILAHRGAMATHPENTLAAFQEAIRLGAHAIEFDVHWTKDRQIVVIHDGTLDRTTDGTGNVWDYTLAELKQLDAGSWKGPRFAGERIPTLAESLAIMPRNSWIMVHIPGSQWVPGTGADLAEAAANVVLGAGREYQAVLLAEAVQVPGIKQAEKDSGRDILVCNTDTRGTGTNYVDQTINGGFDFLIFNGDGFPLADDIQRLKDNGIRNMFSGTDDPDTLTYWFNNGIEFPVVDDLAPSMGVAKGLGIEPLAPLFAPKP